ncbi:LysR substrate-binding domain-containing protein [Aquabacterium sp.]|uniref:LysR substrate-binding domain-containing protein n=1 Tax=Aquabacterium sp. TaxID=1872578 RepID=UPI002CB3BE49|nr:LysR substrate-binding domain-containing protein [Aquabacterium sp.]HSW04837.1 LysR substrate-binding domain-containing protein [Aquabacterium sp.]
MNNSPLRDAGSGAPRALPPIAGRLKALRCVAAVAAQGSAMRAAEAIHLSQPAVTRAVLEMETFCGTPLFERGARGMLATVPGARLAQRAGQLFAQLAAGAEEALAQSPTRPATAGRRGATPQRFAGTVTVAQLKALVAVAATASEVNAARWLGISQPSVHRALRNLEDLAGVALFLSSVRGTRLTDAGEALLRRVKLAFGEARAMASDIAGWRGEVRGRVVIGTLPLSVTLFLPKAIDAARRQHPELEITVIDGTYESLMRQLRSADVDAIVGALRPAPPEVRQELLFEEPLAVIARPGHPCLARRALRLADLLAWEWVMPLQDTPAHAALQRAFAAQGLDLPPDALQANNALFTRSLVGLTDRLALTSHSQALADERAGSFRLVPVPLPETTRRIGVALRNGVEPSPDLAAVLEAMRQAVGYSRAA